MNFRELQELSTAYNKVHESKENSRFRGASAQQAGFQRIKDKESGGPGVGKVRSDDEIRKEKGGQEFLDRIAKAKAMMKKEELDIFDVVLEFLQVEGFAETLEEAEWMMANVIDEEAIDIILGEAKADAGLSPLQKIRKRNKEYFRNNPETVQKTTQRRGEHSSTRGQKKERGAKSAFGTMRNIGGPYKEEYVNEAQAARNNPEKYEREQSKKYAPVRGERTPMPPRGDKRREDFEKWYAKQMGR